MLYSVAPALKGRVGEPAPWAVQEEWGSELLEILIIKRYDILGVICRPSGANQMPRFSLRRSMPRDLTGLGSLRVDTEPLLGQIAARGYDAFAPALFDLDKAKPARAVRCNSLVIAEGRNENAVCTGHVQNCVAFRGGNGLAVYEVPAVPRARAKTAYW